MSAVLICPNPVCRTEGTGRFCNSCGADLTMIACPDCGRRHGQERLADDSAPCEVCGTLLAPRLLVVLPGDGAPAAQNGDLLVGDRYRVLENVGRGQYLAIAMQPNVKRLTTPWSARGPAAAYLSLDRHPGVPALVDCHRAGDGPEVVIVAGPYRKGEPFPALITSWQGATRRQRLSWLAGLVDLVVATSAQGWSGSALALDNLLVMPGGQICVRALLPDSAGAPPAVRLAELWLRLMGLEDEDQAKAYGAAALAQRAASGELSLSEIATEIDRWRRCPPVLVRHAGVSDLGCRRENNEDTFLSWHAEITQHTLDGATVQSHGLFAICDGMGGHASGEVASRTAIRSLRDAVMALLAKGEPGESDIGSHLAQVVREDVNSAVYALNDAKMTLKRMGTTIVGLVQQDQRAWHVHVGDSRLYQVTSAGIVQVTEDHNIGTRDVKRGEATLLEAFRSPVGKHLTQALGPKSSQFVHPDVGELTLDEPSAFVLCSDGLSDMVPERELEHIVRKNWDDPDAAVAELIREANAGGGLDNVTAIVVRVDPTLALFPESPILDRSTSVSTALSGVEAGHRRQAVVSLADVPDRRKGM